MSLADLNRAERMQLMKFVCSFAWTDLEVGDEERAYIRRLMGRLHLDAEERRQVALWLEVPPSPDAVDPTDIPHEHKKLFLDTLRALASKDHDVSEEERVSLALLDQLID